MSNVKPSGPSTRRRGLFSFALLLYVALASADLHAQTPPYWNGGAPKNADGTPAIPPKAWPASSSWIPYSWGTTFPDSTLTEKHPVRDQRTNDPSNGGTTPQNYVNVSSGCPDQSQPSIYYYFDSSNQTVFFRWRVEQIANNYATGTSAGGYSNGNPWNSALWTVFMDLNGDGYRDFAMHLDGSSGSPALPIDTVRSIWSTLKSNSIDYIGSSADIHSLFTNPTAFVEQATGQILQFNGSGTPTTVQWPNGSSETIWDYGSTRSINLSNGSCSEYFVDYEIPLSMLNATAFTGGPSLTPNTPFQFLFATANSLNNPFQKDIVWEGKYVCDATSPGPFGDALTLSGGIIPQPISTSISAGSPSSCSVPVTAQIMDALTVTNCSSTSELVSAQFKYFYDINGNGLDDDGGTWVSIGDPTVPIGTTVTANWNIQNLIQGQYLLALEITDNRGHTTQTWMGKSSPTLTQPFGTDTNGPAGATRNLYTNVPPIAVTFPYSGLSASTLGVNYVKVNVGGACGAPPPTVTKTHSVANPQAGAPETYTLTMTNTSSTAVTVASISDTLPAGFTYQSTGAGTVGVPATSPAVGATGNVVWTFTAGTASIPGCSPAPCTSVKTFVFTVNAGTTGGTFFNTAAINTSIGTLNATDTSGVTVRTAALTASKTAALTTDPTGTVRTIFNRGDVVRFTIVVTNNSQTTCTGVTVTDPLPAGFTYSSASPAPNAAPSVGTNGTVTWSGYTLASGGSTQTFTVDAVAGQAGPITNTATVTSVEAAPVNAATTIYVSGPVLSIYKTANTSVLTPAGTIDYTIEYANIGNQAASITTLTDSVPTGFTLQTGAPTTAGCTQAGSLVTCSFNNTLNPGTTAIVTLRFAVSTSAVDPSTNTATINASNANSATTTFTETIQSTTSCTSANYYFLSTRGSVATGANGYAVGSVNVTTGGSGYTSAPTVVFTGGGGSGAAATAVGNGSGVVASINVTSAGSGYTSTPSVSFSGGGGSGAAAVAFLTNNQYLARTTPGSSDFTITRTVNTLAELARFYQDPVDNTTDYLLTSATVTTSWDNPNPTSSKLNYTIDLLDFDTVTNAQTAIASVTSTRNNGGTFTDTLTVPASTVLKKGHRLLWIISDKDPNGNANTTVTLHINGATAATQSYGTVCLQPLRMSLTKRANKLSVNATGDTIQYTVGYYNASAITLTNVKVYDPIPAGISYTSSSASTGTVAAPATVPCPTASTSNCLVWTIGSVAANGSGTLTINANVLSTIAGLATTNTATLTADLISPVSGSVTTSIVSPNVLVNKRASGTTFVPNDTFTYSIDVFNAGIGNATGVVVSDPLPPGTQYQSASPAPSSAPAVGANGTVSWNVGALASGVSTTLSVTVRVGGAGLVAGDNPVTNTASVVDTYGTTPRTASVTVTVTSTPNLTLSETATPSARRVVFVDVTSGGSYAAVPTVTINQTACPGATAVVSTSPSAGLASATYSVTGVTITNGGTCTSVPAILFNGSCTSCASATATIGPAPGDTITYVVTLANSGTADAAGCVITGSVPTNTTWTSGGTFNLGQVSSTVGTVGAGQSSTLTYTVTVNSVLPYSYSSPFGVVTLSQTASATSSNATAPPPVSASTTTGASPRYAITKTPDGGTLGFPLTTLSSFVNNSATITVASSSLIDVGSYIALSNNGSYVIAQVTGKSGTIVTLAKAVTATGGTNVLPVEKYSLAYSNIGADGGSGVTVTDVLPGGLLYAGTPLSTVASARVTAGGTGYTSAPAVTISGGGGSGATATAIVSGGSVTGIQITSGGSGYSSNPTISFSGGGGTGATASAVLADPVPGSSPAIGSTGSIVWTIGSLPSAGNGTVKFLAFPSAAGVYTNTGVVSDGSALNTRNAFDTAQTTFGALNPSKATTTPLVTNGTGVAHYTITVQNPLPATTATSVIVTDNLPNGFVYKTGSTVVKVNNATTSTTDPAGTTSPVWSGVALNIPASGTLTIDFDANVGANVPSGVYDNEILVSSSIPSLVFDYAGTTAEDVRVCASAPAITAPTACANSTGNVASIALRPAATYTWSINNGGLITSTSTGTVNSVSIASGGSGYATAPTITFSGGGGTGAAATATLSGGVVSSIIITNPGSGYTSAPAVVFSSGTASATAVLGTGIIYTSGSVSATISVTLDEGACSVSTSTTAVVTGPVISVQPTDKTYCNSTTDLTLAVTASGTTAFQWQKSTDGGTTWANAPNAGLVAGTADTGTGATTASYIYRAGTSTTGYKFRVVLTGSSCTFISNVLTITQSCNPDLQMVSAAAPNPVFAGQNITFTQQFTNISTSSVPSGNVTRMWEPIPTGTTFVSMTVPGTFTGTCANTTNGVIAINVLSGGTGYGGGTTVNISAPPAGGVQALAVATIVGGVITAVTVTEPGSGYTSVPAVTFGGGGAGSSGATATAVVGAAERCTTTQAYAAGATSGNFLFVVNVPFSTTDGATITDTVRVTTPNDPNAGNNVTSNTVTVQRSVDMQMSKNDNANIPGYGAHLVYPGNPPVAQPLSWYVTVANAGPSRSSNIVVSDSMPFGFTYGSSSITGGGNACTFNTSTNALTCTVATLDPTPFVSFRGGTGGTSATASISAGGAVTAIAVNTGGSGYTSAPAVYLTGGGGMGATATATVSGGVVTSITVTNGGLGYSSAPVVSFSGGGGSPSAVATTVSGAVASANGSVPAIVVTSGGNGYSSAPTVVISTNGPGSGATGTAVLTACPTGVCTGSYVSGITLTAAGSAYTNTPVITIAGQTTVDTTQIINTATVTQTETDTNGANDAGSDTVTILAPTVVKMLSMEAVQTKKNVTVKWQTSFEQDNLGFYVWRQTAAGTKSKINDRIIIGSALFTAKTPSPTAGRSYRIVDSSAPAGTLQYWIEDVDIKGVHTMNGPITPRFDSTTPPATSGPATDPDLTLGSAGGIFTTAAGMGVTPVASTAPESQRMNQQWTLSTLPAAKLIVTQNGWYRVTKNDLLAAGFDPGSLTRNISVFADGMEVPIATSETTFGPTDSIEFYGTALDTPSAGGHVYYVTSTPGKNLRIRTESTKPNTTASTPASFPYSFVRTERTVYFAALTNNGDGENFFGAIVTSYPASEAVTVTNLDPQAGDAKLEIVIQGATEKFNHSVDVSLNGHSLGVVKFKNQARSVSTLNVPVSWLTSGENTLTFTATGGDDDVSVVETARLTYAHRYAADSNALLFTLPGAMAATVSGFTSPQVRAVDLTDPQQPVLLNVVTAAGANNTKSASFTTSGAGVRTILAFGDDRILSPAQIIYNAPSALNSQKNAADLVILTNKAFFTAAKSLQTARNAQGINTMVVDVQNVYDEFSFGAHGPQAIRAFLQRATTSWSKAPHYVILVGDASFDPRSYLGMGSFDFVPTKVIPTLYLKTASDDWFGDFNDSGIPTLAIGRLPVRTAEEAETVIGKLVKRTGVPVADWAKVIEIINDRPIGVPFELGANLLAASVPAPLSVDRLSFSTLSDPAASVGAAFTRGSLLMNYVGHGSVEIWDDYALTSTSAAALTNGDKLPFVVTMNCLNGFFHDLYTESLAEALMKAAGGGAIGVWASSALTSPDQQLLVNLELYRQLFGSSPQSVGDAILNAKKATTDRDVRRTWILFGDPTMKLK